jgi:CRP-like cAMP-binding protein
MTTILTAAMTTPLAQTPQALRPTPRALHSNLDLVKHLGSLQWLSAAQQKRLAGVLSVVNVERGGNIFRDKGIMDNTYILLSGIARIAHVHPGGRHVLVALIGPGVIPHLPALPAEVSRHFVCDAVNPCRVGKLPTQAFIDIILKVESTDFIKLMDMMVGRLGRLIGRYPSFIGLDLEHRIAVALLELGSEFGVRDSRGILLTLPLTRSDLGNLVGASRQKVSQYLADFERRAMIIRQGRQLVLVTPKLEAFARETHD